MPERAPPTPRLVAWAAGLIVGLVIPFAGIEPWTRRTTRADPAWAFPPDPALGPLTRAAIAVLLCCATLAGATWALRAAGRERRRRGAIILGLGFVASFALLFPGRGGDGVGDLISKSQALREGAGNLFTGGELLGYFAYVLFMNVWPDDWAESAIAASRVIGLLGVGGLIALAIAIARTCRLDDPFERAALVVAVLASPFLVLLGPYPQSTSLMNALAPWFLAAGLLAMLAQGPTRSRNAVWAGALLGLAVGAHGSAWFLGISGAVLTLALLRPALRDAARFTVAFLIPAATAFTIDASWHDRRASAWGFTELDPAKLIGNLGGPLGVMGGSDHFHRPYGEELSAWILSAAPGVALGLLALGIVLLRRQTRQGLHTGAVLFLGSAVGGCAILWSTWEVWFGYPSDWDVTAILALTAHGLAVLLLAALGGARVRLFGLGAIAGISAYSLVSLGSLFSIST